MSGEFYYTLERSVGLETRNARSALHFHLDRIWENPRGPSRGEVYAYLSRQMGLSAEHCHVGMFDRAQCEQAIRILHTASTSEIKRSL